MDIQKQQIARHNPNPAWTPTPLQTSWDDLLQGIDSPAAWEQKRRSVRQRFLALLRDEAAPSPPRDLQVETERAWDGGGFRIHYLGYQVEADERAHAYLAIPDLSSACMLSWMDRWLKYAGDPLGAWDARPTPTA